MTVCNMSIEAGARAGMIAPDETTFEYLQGRPRAPPGADWERAVAGWRTLPTRCRAPRFDREVDIDAARLEPMITYGTNPGMVVPISGSRSRRSGDDVFSKALDYMGFEPGETHGRQAGRRRVHRQLHQRAALRPAGRRQPSCAAARSPRACACWSCPARSRSSARPKREGLDRDVHRRRRRMARVRLLDVPRHERRHRRRRASTASAPATAISKAGRAPARARCWPARQPPPPPPSPAHHRPARICSAERGQDHGSHPTPSRSRTVVLPSTNIDTDQIIPARFLTTTTREGLGAALFADWRYDARGAPQAGFRAEPARRRPGCAGAGRRPQLRLRLVARACALGAARLRLPRGDQHRDRRHLPQQLP